MANFRRDGGGGMDDADYDAFRKRRPRPVTDFGSSLLHWTRRRRPAWKGISHYEQERPSISYIVDVLPPAGNLGCPAESIPTRFLHQSLGKSKKPVTIVRWTPEGRRLLAGVHNGEFMLWNGMSFNFETVTAMGSASLRSAEWSHNGNWLIAANDEGTIFYLQPTLNQTHQIPRAHDQPIRDLAWSPNDSKFVSASDDNTVKVWDFTSSQSDTMHTEHGWDVKSVDWHPTKGLIASGSKDNTICLWDPRTARNLTKLHGHKQAISQVSFSRLRPQLLASASRDNLSRIFDLRMMRDVAILRGHEKGVTALSWHPVHPSIVSTGGEDGALYTYLLTEPNTPAGASTANSISPYNTSNPRTAPAQSLYPAHKIQYSHESAIWSMDWHPLGHILATGSNDHYIRFWSRSQPGDPQDCFRDKYHLGEEAAEAQGTYDRKLKAREAREQEEQEAEDEAEGLEDQTRQPHGIPGLPGLASIPGLPGLQSAYPPPLSNGRSSLSVLPLGANGLPPIPPGVSMDRLAHLLPTGTHALPFPPPGVNGFDYSKISQSLPPLPPGVRLPGLPGFELDVPGLSGLDGAVQDPRLMNGGGGVRSRAPLPSQQDSLKYEQAAGRYRQAR